MLYYFPFELLSNYCTYYLGPEYQNTGDFSRIPF